MNGSTRWWMALGVAVGTMAVSSCGVQSEELTKPEFIEQANEICARTDAELEAVWDAVWAMEGIDPADGEEPTPESQDLLFIRFADAVTTSNTAWREASDEIRALDAPADDKAIIDTLLDDLDTAIDELQGIAEAAAAGDEAARARMDGTGNREADGEDPLRAVNQRAFDYGLTVCGAPS